MNTSDFTENGFLKLIDNLDQRGTSLSDGVLFSPFRPFEDLSMKERAAVIRIGVLNGLRDLESIRSKYNEFAEGGDTEVNEEYYPIWLDGVTVKPSGNRPTTRDDWNWANWRELQNEREQQAAESVRRGIDRNGTPIAAGIYGLMAAPFAVEGLGSSTVANGVRTGLQVMNTAFTPSTWLNPVTGAKMLSPTVGTVADAGIQGAFAYEGLNGLYNQGREGTLLSDPANTVMHGLEVLPLAGPLGYAAKSTIGNYKQKMQNIIDMSKMSKWTSEQWTAAQDAAIARRDMAEAQRLRDLHFIIYQNGDMVDVNGNPIHVYHGSPEENITEFYKPNDPRLPAPKGINFKATGEEGIYTSPRKGYAANYMADLGGRYRVPLTKEQKALLKAGKTREEIGLPSIPKGRIYDLYSNTKLVPENLDIDFNPFTLSTKEANLIKSKGYTGFNIPGKKYPEHVVLEPNQLKSADAVTVDDNGVRIPLGERDNFSNLDIRWGLLPWIFGGGTAGYNYLNQDQGPLVEMAMGGKINSKNKKNKAH